MVQDCSWRPCGDFHCLNLISEADCYPLPNMVDFTSILAGATIFSKLDLKKGYHQIPVYPSDIKKTTIITTFGLFKFLRMPFGLKNASITFQRFMDRCLAGLPFMLVYLENILIASPDRQTHAAHVHQVLEPLQANSLVLNNAKQCCRAATFWMAPAPAPDGQGPGAGSGSNLLGSAPAPAPGKKRRLQAAPAPAPYTKIFHFKLLKI